MKKNNKNEELVYIPLNDYKNYHYLNDIDLATTLICKGYELIDISPVNYAKYTFVFKNTESILDIVEKFWSNKIEVNPLEFANTRKNLKSRIYGMNK